MNKKSGFTSKRIFEEFGVVNVNRKDAECEEHWLKIWIYPNHLLSTSQREICNLDKGVDEN